MTFKRIVRWTAALLVVLLVIGAAVAGYYLLWQGRAPGKRPDLVRIPEGAPPAPGGYPTTNALMLAYALGRLEILDTKAEVPLPPGVHCETGIEYGRAGDTALLLDLYTPANLDEDRPGLIFIHGGGWEQGHRNDYRIYTTSFAQDGYVAATISYRFAQDAKFPGCVEDAKCAVRWMRENAKDLHVDPNRIAVIGGSAGGYLVLMTGYSSDVPELEGQGGHPGVSSRPDAVINFYGPVDLTTEYARNAREVKNFLPKSYEEDPALYELASPPASPRCRRSAHIDLAGHARYPRAAPPIRSACRKTANSRRPSLLRASRRLAHTMDAAVPVNAYVQKVMRLFLEEVFGGKP